MEEWQIIFQSLDRSNIFMSTLKLPNRREAWFEYMDHGAETKWHHFSQETFFAGQQKTVCQLYNFYRDKLKKVLSDKAGTDVPENSHSNVSLPVPSFCKACCFSFPR